MLKPRRLNSPETRARTPGRSSTSTEIVCVLIQVRTSRRVAAACSSGENSGPRMISSLGRPAGTIGKTPSWVSTRKSTTTDWSSVASAFSRVASTSVARSQRRPRAP